MCVHWGKHAGVGGLMHGWVSGWVSGWIDRKLCGWVIGSMDRKIIMWMSKWVDGGWVNYYYVGVQFC